MYLRILVYLVIGQIGWRRGCWAQQPFSAPAHVVRGVRPPPLPGNLKPETCKTGGHLIRSPHQTYDALTDFPKGALGNCCTCAWSGRPSTNPSHTILLQITGNQPKNLNLTRSPVRLYHALMKLIHFSGEKKESVC